MAQWIKDLGAWLAGLDKWVQLTAFVCVTIVLIVALLVRLDVGGILTTLTGK